MTEYRPGAGIGWHRDAPPFGIVAGVSLAGTCRMRFQTRGRLRQGYSRCRASAKVHVFAYGRGANEVGAHDPACKRTTLLDNVSNAAEEGRGPVATNQRRRDCKDLATA